LRTTYLSARLQSHVAHYGESHQTSQNMLFHYVGIPFLMISGVGLLAKIPLPFADEHAALQPNVAWIFLVAAGMWYFWMDAVAAVFLSLMFAGAYAIGNSMAPGILGVGFGIGVVAHVIGHAVFEKKPPSVLKNPLSLLVAPAWLLERIGY
jgi:uncharacterized membrane protein YGL010W